MDAAVSNGDAGDAATLTLLQERLHRLEFLLHGRTDAFGISFAAKTPSNVDGAVVARLEKMRTALQRLTAQQGAVRDILDLDSRYPELFAPATEDQTPSTLDESVLTSIVLAHTSTFTEVLARLNLVKELPIPPASLSAELIELQPRLDRARERQETELQRITDLRVRSARLLERWLQEGILGRGQVWAECQERVMALERKLRRAEAARARESNGI